MGRSAALHNWHDKFQIWQHRHIDNASKQDPDVPEIFKGSTIHRHEMRFKINFADLIREGSI